MNLKHRRRRSDFEPLEARLCLTAIPVQVADINKFVDFEDVDRNSSHIREYFEYNGEVFFQATNVLGDELWKTDGTEEGTTLVRNLHPGGNGSNPRNFTEVGGNLYFFADRQIAASNESIARADLWMSDGTPSGTLILKKGVSRSPNFEPEMLGQINDELYFAVGDGAEGITHYDLWKTDGTIAGTTLVKGFEPGTADKPFGVDSSFKSQFGDELYFAASDMEHGLELWKTDGSQQGTQLVFDSNEGPLDGMPFSPVEMDDWLYFVSLVNEPELGLVASYLHRTDGTQAGTERVSDLRVDGETELLNHNGLVYFTGGNSETGFEPHRTNGAVDGTVRLKDVFDGPTSSNSHRYFVAMDRVFFIAADSDGDTGLIPNLWTTDGTTENTQKLSATALDLRKDFVEFRGNLYFAGTTQEFGHELHRTDGTLSGTSAIDLTPGPASSDPWPKAVFDDFLYMVARDDEHGYELWRTDGTAAGSVLVNDLNEGPLDFTPVISEFELFPYRDIVLFYGTNDSSVGNELWSLRQPLPADIDLSGSVDFVDFLLLAASFGQQGDDLDGDIDGDGSVGFKDFLALAMSFGQTV